MTLRRRVITTTTTTTSGDPSVDALANQVYRTRVESVPRDHGVHVTRTIQYVPARVRHFTPEPISRRATSLADKYRRYSTAGNLDLYRPDRYHSEVLCERIEPLKVFVSHDPTVYYNYWGRPPSTLDYIRHPLNEYDLRKEAELRVKGRNNGPIATSYYVAPPLVSYSQSAPVETPNRTQSARASVARQPITSAGRALTESQNELEEFERLMKRTFGRGGVNRNGTPLYTAPPYYYPYSYTSGYLPYYSHYNPYYYYSPYYRSVVGSTLDTLPDYYVSPTYTGPYMYAGLKPSEYDYRMSSSRVAAPGGYYVSYYDPIISGYDRYPARYTTYSVIR